MSRIPQPSPRPTVKTTLAPPSRSRAPSPSKPAASAPSPRVRTKSVPKSPSKAIRRPPPVENEPPIPKTPLSVKEAVALKRAEARKAASTSSSRAGFGNSASFGDFENLEGADPIISKKNEDETPELGRWSVKETIERARSTGAINLSSRSLPCIPSALFEIHLGVTPDTLKSVASEPPVSSSTDTSSSSRRAGQREGPAWFEAQDLHVLKAWNNNIVEIQHEISLFGSLKTVDLHQNRIILLPDTFADLTALTTLDLSHNSLTALPSNIFALPNLTVMNLSHNALSELSFGAPFSKSSSRRARNDTFSSGGFFGPVITRASSPLPRLSVLDASHNKLTASSIDHANLPRLITKADFAANPLALGDSNSTPGFIRALSHLEHLKELRCETADIGDDAFPSNLSDSDGHCFPRLRILDMGETRATMEGLRSALSGLKQDITYDFTTEEPPEGTLRVSIGKKVVREAWEVEAERRVKNRASKSVASTEGAGVFSKIDIDQNNAEVVKEAWEIEAEQGLLTEGGRRRARAAAEMSANTVAPPKLSTVIGRGRPPTPASTSQPSLTASLTNPQYYHATTQTLTLPPLSAPKGHARSFSLATPFSSSPSSQGKTDFALPTLTLPLAALSAQLFAPTLKILVLSNRKFNLCVSLPTTGEVFLPSLEELVLDGCGFGDQVSVTRQADTGTTTPPRSSDMLLPLLTRMFPSLRTLDLSYNALTSASLQQDVLSSLILADNSISRKGLRHLRLRGNRINEIDGFQGIADLFKGNRSVPDWKLEELDLRDNEISKLPAELGLLPLDIFLVDGNLFRIPQRRVWEREGTRGLLSWLRGRLE
ncbi:hypothetical protein DEU56DRAFT_814250 [Suillus clintonianus]|uniref:uncharacterized protein n=1 Tax=Suillus clintonianus TaxID=1904413 RepID=UPI001B85E7B1|nr:uncharacterized protein DEU56DRAFT_814250 [Suillus clintonianus]KAG2131383.1 hypothetical protein DEU56DRAFT_814250 [Suillus clintonianus]